jgi:hypothetical protein
VQSDKPNQLNLKYQLEVNTEHFIPADHPSSLSGGGDASVAMDGRCTLYDVKGECWTGGAGENQPAVPYEEAVREKTGRKGVEGGGVWGRRRGAG